MDADETSSNKPSLYIFMIVGSGLLARAFWSDYAHNSDVCLYAAGVSNSSCTDAHEFERERQRLGGALAQASHAATFVYFGTCSIADPDARETPYVQHKLAMEKLVSSRPNFLILRLPQVAGKTPNPHTLLNYLYARISRSEAFMLWRKAKRNIIDVDDAATIARLLFADTSMRNITVNIANPDSYAMTDIVHAMERAVGKKAIFEIVERGTKYPVDIGPIRPLLGKTGINFDASYLDQVIGKYYGTSVNE